MLVELIASSGQLISNVGTGTYTPEHADDFIPSRSQVPVSVRFYADDAATPILIVPAQGTLQFTAQPANGDTFSIGATTYTARTALSTGPTVANEVLLGANQAAFIANLVGAINHATTGGQATGTTYGAGTVAHPDVTAVNATTAVVVVSKTPNQSALGIATTKTSAAASFAAPTLTTGIPDQLNLDVKPAGQYDAGFTFVSPTFSAPNTADGYYAATLSTNTTQANTALDPNSAAGASAIEPSVVPLMGQVSWGEDGSLSRSDIWTIQLRNSIRHGGETAATPA